VNFEHTIQTVYRTVKALPHEGKLADYIPELARVDPDKLGVYLATIEGSNCGRGDCTELFSVQSIAKVLSLCLAYKLVGETLWERVDVEPSGTPFNSLVQLEADRGIPRNPFINAGAMVICDVLVSHLEQPKADVLTFIRSITNNTSLNYCSTVAASEKSVGFRNVALCNFIKSFGNIHNDPSEVLDFYFDLCSLEMSCQELAELFLFLANKGRRISDQHPILTTRQSKRINALMQTCGFYDESGEFAFEVGLPGKSGVGGGIIAVHPNQYAIAVWSPQLNERYNSYKGMRFLEAFTTLSQSSIF
jgi:glutaminase